MRSDPPHSQGCCPSATPVPELPRLSIKSLGLPWDIPRLCLRVRASNHFLIWYGPTVTAAERLARVLSAESVEIVGSRRVRHLDATDRAIDGDAGRRLPASET